MKIKIPVAKVIALLVLLIEVAPRGIDRAEAAELGQALVEVGAGMLGADEPRPFVIDVANLKGTTTRVRIPVRKLTRLVKRFFQLLPGGITEDEAEELGRQLVSIGVSVLGQVLPDELELPVVPAAA